MCEKQLLDVELKKCGGLEAGGGFFGLEQYWVLPIFFTNIFLAITILGFTRVRSGLVHSMDLHKIEQMFEKIFLSGNFHICVLTFVLLVISLTKCDSLIHLHF